MPECTLRHHMQSHSNSDGNLDYAKVHGLRHTFRQPKKHPYVKHPMNKHRNKHPKSQNQHITHMQIHSANYVQGMYTDGDLCGHTHACLSEHRHTRTHTCTHSCPNRDMGNMKRPNHSAPPLLGHRQCKPSSTPKHTQSQAQTLRQ